MTFHSQITPEKFKLLKLLERVPFDGIEYKGQNGTIIGFKTYRNSDYYILMVNLKKLSIVKNLYYIENENDNNYLVILNITKIPKVMK